MAVLIKGMKTPENCLQCRLMWDGWCYALPETAAQSEAIHETERPDWCPLVEIPKTKSPMTNKELEECNFEL